MTVPPPPGSPDGSAGTASVTAPVTYATGSWIALVLDDLALLLDLPADSRLLAHCWSIAAGGHGLDAVLGVVTAPGPQSVANYAAAIRTAEGTRVVVAGSARAEIGGAALTADGGARDERVAGRPPVRLAAGTGAGADPAVLPLARGIAPAAAIGIGVAAGGGTAAAAPQAPSCAVDQMPVPRVSSNTMPPASVYDSGIIESLPWRGTAEEPAAPAAAAAPPPPAPTPTPPAPPSWGDPFAGGDATGADPHPHNPWGAPAPAWPPVTPPAPEASPVAPPAPPAAWGAPGGAEPPQASPWAPAGAPSGPPDASSPAPPVDEGSGPVVHAFACPRGHLNPPYAGTCRICDESIPAQEGFAASRPSLGVLKLSTGDTVPLDRDVVLGRAPFHADESAASRPHLVQLASPGNDISRSHVRVNLENWFVQVTDLGSTNGTVITLPDQAPVRLRPHDPFTILPGTTVNIADEITLRYEVS